MQIRLHSTQDLPAAARALQKFAADERFFVFEGQMGAGKTTFIKEFCSLVGVEDVVSSPTFSIVNVYSARGDAFYHFDFYRIRNLEEAYDIGYEEYFYGSGVCLVEWAEKIRPLLPERYIEVTLEVLSDTARQVTFTRKGS